MEKVYPKIFPHEIIIMIQNEEDNVDIRNVIIWDLDLWPNLNLGEKHQKTSEQKTTVRAIMANSPSGRKHNHAGKWLFWRIIL